MAKAKILKVVQSAKEFAGGALEVTYELDGVRHTAVGNDVPPEVMRDARRQFSQSSLTAKGTKPEPVAAEKEAQAKAAAAQTAAGLEQPAPPTYKKLPPGIDAAYARIAAEEAGTLGQPEMYGESGATELPGYPGLTVARYMASFYRAPKGGMVATQKALIAAGYLKYDEDVINGDPFDGKTRDALMSLMQDSILSGSRPEEIIRYRVELAGGHKPGMLKPGDQDRAQWEAEMRDSYEEAWGHKQMMPADYLADKTYMNPEELSVYERSKVLWQKSGVAQSEQDLLTKQLFSFFNKAPNTGQSIPAGLIPGQQLPAGYVPGQGTPLPPATPQQAQQSVPRQGGGE